MTQKQRRVVNFDNERNFLSEFREKEAALLEEEGKLITIALAKTSGHREQAAELLGMPIRTFQRRIAERLVNNF